MTLFYILLGICLIGWITIAVVALKNDDDEEEEPEYKLVYTNEYGYIYIQNNKKVKNEK